MCPNKREFLKKPARRFPSVSIHPKLVEMTAQLKRTRIYFELFNHRKSCTTPNSRQNSGLWLILATNWVQKEKELATRRYPFCPLSLSCGVSAGHLTWFVGRQDRNPWKVVVISRICSAITDCVSVLCLFQDEA